MIPPQPDPSTRSSAERQVFNWLAQIEEADWTYALHSLNLAQHRWKKLSEIDFLLLGRRGVFVLEVKGGRVACHAGVWEFTDRYGETRRRRQGPFKQAESAMFSLRDRLEELLPRGVPRTTFGFAVLFPDIEFSTTSVEWDEEMVIDLAQLSRPDGLRRSLGRMTSYWRSKPGGPNLQLSEPQVDEILRALRPDFDTVCTLSSISRGVEQELVRLTENQYKALDSLAKSPRIVFEGGAGTGKTLLAAEACRRAAALGERVLYTCSSAVIAHHVGGEDGLANVDAVAFERLRTLPEAKYDLLVVDEAQDVITYEGLGELDRRVEGGLENGRWLLFMDSNNQKGLVGRFDAEAMDYVATLRPATFTLTDNCRNTRQIVTSTEAMTGAELGVTAAGAGPEVEVLRPGSVVEAVESVAGFLTRLSESGVDAGDVTLLSPRPFAESLFERLPPRWRFLIDPLDLNASRRPPGRYGFATVADFKGLEARFVVVADLKSAAGHDERGNMYVGMTRARVGLCVVLNA